MLSVEVTDLFKNLLRCSTEESTGDYDSGDIHEGAENDSSAEQEEKQKEVPVSLLNSIDD